MKSLLLPLMLFLAACLNNEEASPEGAIKSFVEARMGQVVSREFILKKVTGKLKQSVQNISDEEFARFADLRNVKKDSLKVLSKSCQEKKCFVTYSLSYVTNNDKEEKKYTTEVKKIAEVINENGKWLIADVSNIKTYHEALEPINP